MIRYDYCLAFSASCFNSFFLYFFLSGPTEIQFKLKQKKLAWTVIVSAHPVRAGAELAYVSIASPK
jgi:hypothetical protein